MDLSVCQNLISLVPSELTIFFEIGIMIIIAAILAFLIRLVRQPLIPAYIITGILLGPLALGLIQDPHLVKSLSEIGVAFLIFTAGLEIKFKKLREVGKVASIGGVFQIAILFAIAFFISTWFGFIGKAPIYIGLVVAFSSTMIVMKLLADKRELNSLHGRIVIGILLVQDIIAIIALSVLASDLTLNSILIVLLKAFIFGIIAIILAKVMNPIFNIAAKNHELLILVSISFLFTFVIGSFIAGLSLIIGAFFAGVALANSNYKVEIEGKIRPLRDFFAVIFFVALGLQLAPIPKQLLILMLILLVLVIVIKPWIIMFSVRIFGYKRKTSFLTGNALAQTSEFSLIIVTLGLGLGHISQDLFSALVLLTIITMSLTTYFIIYERKIEKYMDLPLILFNKFKSDKENLEYSVKDGKRTILFGCHRAGSLLIKELKNNKEDLLVIDYNPEIIKSLINKKIPCIYGDFANPEVLSKANLKNAEMVISTIPDFEDNLLLIKKTRNLNSKVPIFVITTRISEALKLYKEGADYVIIPQVMGGEKFFELMKKIKRDKTSVKEMKKEHLRHLKEIHHLLY
ncbi:hypothetical protein HOD75_04560 [archaeon]|jgi:Kef-type K+ transport system membrane component KefB|nr:hypothetical protein [archaeon]MBT4242137.1 hypothetical protein [archaeon]MBT4417825.1 hypothetical protein [archaeon]